MRKSIVVLTGAGISAESGLKTFRDQGGLWEGHDVMEVASPEGWQRNPEMVLDFYNQRRRQLRGAMPNNAHKALKTLEEYHDVTIITQNVDDLHERAGSKNVIHLHGELLKMRSTASYHLIYDCTEDIVLGDLAEDGAQLRPHIVWFGENVPMMELASIETQKAEILLIVGTSMQVYPAASLVHFAPKYVPIYYVDPAPQISAEMAARDAISLVRKKASIGVQEVVNKLID